jgi:AmiR/NasT family two-component response regulator
MLSYRMDIGPGLLGGLNVYSDRVDAFDDAAAAIGLLLATHGAIAASAVAHRTHAEQLEHALASNRKIGMAIGILMATHKVTDKQAFDLLRIASQNTNRKLRHVAADVIEVGTLDVVSPLRDI